MSRVEVAALYGVDAKTVDRWAKQGLIPSLVLPGGHRRYVRADIEANAAQNGWTEHSSLNDD